MILCQNHREQAQLLPTARLFGDLRGPVAANRGFTESQDRDRFLRLQSPHTVPAQVTYRHLQQIRRRVGDIG